MTHCQLFTKRTYQYGPSLMVQSLMFDQKSPRSALVYYPMGSGKTLAALHAARVFLQTSMKSKVIVLTTKTNIDDAWKTNQAKYEASESFKFDDIIVKNVEWWFSEDNKPLTHYNRLIRLLTQATGATRRTYLTLTWSALINEIRYCKSNKKLREMRKVVCTTPKKSFLDVCCPNSAENDYILIVDECQQYINNCATSLLVEKLCKRAGFTLLLSATPFDSCTQYPGLCRMLGTCHLEKRILYVQPMRHQNVRHRYMGSKMLPDEWQEYVFEKNKRQDAYLSRSRQFCNATSKWSRMLRQIQKDKFHRTVVYSFFRERGADGFYDYATRQDSSCTVQFRMFKDSSDIDWFHSESEASKVLLITSRAQTGISLKGVDAFHLMEPQWSSSDEEQCVGRVTRIGARTSPEPVMVYHWLAQAPNRQWTTADESVFDSSLRKKVKTDRLLANLAVSGGKTLKFLLGVFQMKVQAVT